MLCPPGSLPEIRSDAHRVFLALPLRNEAFHDTLLGRTRVIERLRLRPSDSP